MKCEVFILAGGLSTRMGRDKSKLRLGRRTMLSIIREMAQQLHFPVRVIRRDLVPRARTALHRAVARLKAAVAALMPSRRRATAPASDGPSAIGYARGGDPGRLARFPAPHRG